MTWSYFLWSSFNFFFYLYLVKFLICWYLEKILAYHRVLRNMSRWVPDRILNVLMGTQVFVSVWVPGCLHLSQLHTVIINFLIINWCQILHCLLILMILAIIINSLTNIGEYFNLITPSTNYSSQQMSQFCLHNHLIH